MIPDEQWKNMEEHQDQDLSALINIKTITKLPSNDPLQKIKRNLIINSLWGLLIVCLYLFIIIRFPLWQVQLCIGTVMVFTFLGALSALRLYRKINDNVLTNSLLQEMERHYYSIQHWMSLQQNVGLLLYPVSAAGGFMLGGFVGSGKPIEVFMSKPIIIIILLVVIAILVPLCYKLAKWMSKKSFGQYADQLKKNIDALKSDL
jgi:hypothetical protein